MTGDGRCGRATSAILVARRVPDTTCGTVHYRRNALGIVCHKRHVETAWSHSGSYCNERIFQEGWLAQREAITIQQRNQRHCAAQSGEIVHLQALLDKAKMWQPGAHVESGTFAARREKHDGASSWDIET